MARGWTPTPWQGKSDNYKDTGVATWCSSVTAKPPECRHDPLATLGRGDRVFNRRMQSSGKPGFPVRSVHGGRVELLHNYKVAGTALKRYMTCEYGTEADTDHVLSVLPVRDPIDRFVSAVGEVLRLQMYLPELRDALKARGLDTTGTKMKMVERLTKATAGNASAHGIRHGRLSVQAACDFCRREVEEVRQKSVARRGKPLTLQRAAAIRCRPRALSARADKAVSLTGRLEPPCDHCPVCNSLEPAPSRGRGARAAAPRAAAARAAAARAAAARAAGRGRGRGQGRGGTRG